MLSKGSLEGILPKKNDQFTTIKVGKESFPTSVEHFQKANEFLAILRDKMAVFEKSFNGAAKQPESFYKATEAILSQGEMLQGLGDVLDKKLLLLMQERLEGSAKRVGVKVPEELRPAIMRVLGAELMANSQSYDIKPKDMVSFTVYNGVKKLEHFSENPKYKEFYATTPYVFKFAVIGRARMGAAEKFLDNAMKVEMELRSDPVFSAAFAETPYVFRRAAINYSGEGAARKHLEDGLDREVELKKDPVAGPHFKDTPFIFRRVAMEYSDVDAAKSYLRDCIKREDELQADPVVMKRFAEDKWVIKHAAGKKNAVKFLHGVIKREAELLRDPEFKDLARDNPAVILTAALYHPGKGSDKKYLRDIMKVENELREHEVLGPHFADTPHMFRRAAVLYAGKKEEAEGYLHNVRNTELGLQGDKGFSRFFEGNPYVFRYVATSHPEEGEAKDFMREVVKKCTDIEKQLAGQMMAKRLVRSDVIHAVLHYEDPVEKLNKTARTKVSEPDNSIFVKK